MNVHTGTLYNWCPVHRAKKHFKGIYDCKIFINLIKKRWKWGANVLKLVHIENKMSEVLRKLHRLQRLKFTKWQTSQQGFLSKLMVVLATSLLN